MDRVEARQFCALVNGERKGDRPDEWANRAVLVDNRWDDGSEEEKFAVLTAIRKFYNPSAKSNIRGIFSQSADQVGQLEGFLQLRYRHAEQIDELIVIVKFSETSSRISPFED